MDKVPVQFVVKRDNKMDVVDEIYVTQAQAQSLSASNFFSMAIKNGKLGAYKPERTQLEVRDATDKVINLIRVYLIRVDPSQVGFTAPR